MLTRKRLFSIARRAREGPGRSHQVIAELAELLAVIARQQPEVYVEIGTYYGGGTWAVQQAAPDTTIVCIDNGSLDSSVSTEDCLKALGVNAALIEGDSQESSTLAKLQKLVHRVDFLFIDGDHHDEAVRRDFELYAPLVREGGVVALHDIHSQHPDDHVGRLWRELRASACRTTEIHAHAGWGGVGLVWV